jgi:hypothetical protein
MSHAPAESVAGGPGVATPGGLPPRGLPLRWLALGLAAVGIFSSYYESDAIGPIADLLGRQRGFTQSQIGDLTAVISLPNIRWPSSTDCSLTASGRRA